MLLKGTKFDKWHHKNPTKVYDAEQNLNGPLIVWGVMFQPIWININSENIRRKIRAFISIKQCRFVFQSAFVMTLVMILFVLLTSDTMPTSSPPLWAQSLRYHPKIFTLLSTERHKCILSSVRDIFHSCFKVWTLNPKHTLPFFHARTNSPKSDSVMRCCLTCMQHLCKPFGILQKKSESGRKKERERGKEKGCHVNSVSNQAHRYTACNNREEIEH